MDDRTFLRATLKSLVDRFGESLVAEHLLAVTNPVIAAMLDQERADEILAHFGVPGCRRAS